MKLSKKPVVESILSRGLLKFTRNAPHVSRTGQHQGSALGTCLWYLGSCSQGNLSRGHMRISLVKSTQHTLKNAGAGLWETFPTKGGHSDVTPMWQHAAKAQEWPLCPGETIWKLGTGCAGTWGPVWALRDPGCLRWSELPQPLAIAMGCMLNTLVLQAPSPQAWCRWHQAGWECWSAEG